MTSLKDKVVFITGASSGIGEACAKQYAACGAHLILTARREDRLAQLAAALEAEFGISCHIAVLDVRNKASVNRVIKQLPTAFQHIDILINNAGLALDKLPLQSGDSDNWDIMIDTNIKGLLYVTQAILPIMLARQSGHIVNIGSVAGHDCYPNGNVYSATKFAVNALSRSMRLDLIGTPLRVTEIAPGGVRTEFAEVRMHDKAIADKFYESFVPLEACDIADAIIYCTSRPAHVDVATMIIMPTVQASANHVTLLRRPAT